MSPFGFIPDEYEGEKRLQVHVQALRDRRPID